jgi:hypothetical protein
MTVQVTVDTGRLTRILRNLGGNTRDAVRKLAFRVEAEAKVNAARNFHGTDDKPNTGALMNSIYVHMSGGDSPPDVSNLNPDAISVPLPTPGNTTTAHVGPSVHYAIYQELGTHKMVARPYLAPAVETVASELERNPELFRGVVTDD